MTRLVLPIQTPRFLKPVSIARGDHLESVIAHPATSSNNVPQGHRQRPSNKKQFMGGLGSKLLPRRCWELLLLARAQVALESGVKIAAPRNKTRAEPRRLPWEQYTQMPHTIL